MGRKKSKITVIEAVREVYEGFPEIWHGIILIETVRSMLGRPMCCDGTIFRKLRELRQDGEINYKCINNDISIYKKL